MKMKNIFFLVVLAGVHYAHAAISSPDERAVQLETIEKLVHREVKTIKVEVSESIRNPFIAGFSKAVVMEEKKADLAVEVPSQVLPLLLDKINPTGIFAINGEYYLMFKEKRLRAGQTIPVEHGGREYSVQLDQVTHKDYTLTLDGITIQQKLK